MNSSVVLDKPARILSQTEDERPNIKQISKSRKIPKHCIMNI